jgi:hypothetical protein
MAKTVECGLLGDEVAAQQSKNVKTLGRMVCALAAGGMLGLAINGYKSSSPTVSELAAATGTFSRAGLGARHDILRRPAFSNPLAKLALKSIAINERMNSMQGAMTRDVAAKAKKDLTSGWDLVDEGVKNKLSKNLEQIKYSNNYLAGITAPVGYFDPLGFSTDLTPGKLLFYREVELKHGRVAMLAALGFVVGENYHPLFGGNIDSPAIYAFQETPLQTFWGAVVLAMAIPEVYSVFTFDEPGSTAQEVVKKEGWTIKLDHEPGNLGFDPLGLKPTDPDEFVTMQTKELNNGRLAMIAVAGMIAQEVVTGEKLFS